MLIAILVILILMLFGAFPVWKYNQRWGYGPFSGIGGIIVLLAILIMLGVI